MKADRSLDKLQPHFRIRVDKLLKLHPEVAVHEAWRSDERQKYLLETGASKVTRSNHQDGLAVDIHFKVEPHFPSGDDPRWEPVRETAKKLSIISGYDLWDGWDANHFQDMYMFPKWKSDFLNHGVEQGWTNAEDALSPIDLPRMMGLLKKFNESNNL